MIDFLKYVELKNKGMIVLQKVGENRAMLIKRQFDPSHGGEGEPQVGHIQIDDLMKTRENMQSAIQGIDTFINDLATLGIKPTGSK